ncbi:MAG TPA: hypothetical protein VHV28_17830 [Solirubrobacteraceae bacterium]|nr:hypothetical protein [Solirubrobacteraceae bacterium]
MPFNTADLPDITKANPYIQRLLEDAELRDNVRAAAEHGKTAASRLSSAKAPQRALIDDKKLQNELRSAFEAGRDAAMALSDAPNRSKPKQKKGGLGSKLMILVIGAIIALAVSEGLRSKVLDALFGAEEEFQYTPPAGTPTPPPASAVPAA